MKIKKENLSTSKLNSLYLGKKIIYKSHFGKIINIAYYSNLPPVPYAEIEIYLEDCRTETKILPLSELVLVFGAA